MEGFHFSPPYNINININLHVYITRLILTFQDVFQQFENKKRPRIKILSLFIIQFYFFINPCFTNSALNKSDVNCEPHPRGFLADTAL